VCAAPPTACVQVHHGNGTQQIFEGDPRVLFVSLHRRDEHFYPQVALCVCVCVCVSPPAAACTAGMCGARGAGMRCLTRPSVVLRQRPPWTAQQGVGYETEVGKGAGAGFNVNVPWSSKGMGDQDYMAAYELLLAPILAAFDPQLVLISAGFDAAEGDFLGKCVVRLGCAGCSGLHPVGEAC
jgi:hypothetical protein